MDKNKGIVFTNADEFYVSLPFKKNILLTVFVVIWALITGVRLFMEISDSQSSWFIIFNYWLSFLFPLGVLLWFFLAREVIQIDSQVLRTGKQFLQFGNLKEFKIEGIQELKISGKRNNDYFSLNKYLFMRRGQIQFIYYDRVYLFGSEVDFEECEKLVVYFNQKKDSM